MAAGEPEAAAAGAEGAEAPAEATEGKEATGAADAQVNGVKPAASTDPLSFPPHGTEVQCPLSLTYPIIKTYGTSAQR